MSTPSYLKMATPPIPPYGPRYPVPMISKPSNLRTTALPSPVRYQNTNTSTSTHLRTTTHRTPLRYQISSTSTPPHYSMTKFGTTLPYSREPHPYTALAPRPLPYQPSPSLPSPRPRPQDCNPNSPAHQKPPTYHLSIDPLLDLQRQLQTPIYPPTYPSPRTIAQHRQSLYMHLSALYQTMKHEALTTFFIRLICPRCGQLPISDHLFQSTSLLDLNHWLPAEGTVLWRTLRREMEGVDLLRLRQGHLDRVVLGLLEVERLFKEGEGGGCGVESWSGGREEVGMD